MTKARIIDGKGFALDLRTRIAAQVAALKESHGLEPGLAVVLVGDDPASQVYVRNKGQATLAAGMRSFEHKLPDTVDQATLGGAGRTAEPGPRRQRHPGAVAAAAPDRPRRRHRDDRSGQGRRWFPRRERRPAGAGASRSGPLHAAGLHDAAARHRRRPEGAAGAGARPLRHRRQADGEPAAGGGLHRHGCPFAHPGPCRGMPARGHPGGGRRPAGDGARRLDQAGRHRHRRRHQPRRRCGRGQDAAGRRRRLSPKRPKWRAPSRRCPAELAP